MDLRQIRRYIAIVEAGSLGKAAEALSISQPGLSKCIHQLETAFGAKLLDRGPLGVTSTPFGRAVYLHAKRILAEWRHLENERVAMFAGLVGHVTIGAARGTGFLSRVLPAVSTKFTRQSYAVHLTVVSGVADELARALRLGDLDFAVAVFESNSMPGDLHSEVLFHDRYGLFVDAAHPLAVRGGEVSIQDLVQYCWLYSTDAVSLFQSMSTLARVRALPPRRTVIDSNSAVYLTSALVGNEFIGMLSMDAVGEAVTEGRLMELSLNPREHEELGMAAVIRPIGFLRRADTVLSPLAVALQDEIRRLCSKLGYPQEDAKSGIERAPNLPRRARRVGDRPRSVK